MQFSHISIKVNIDFVNKSKFYTDFNTIKVIFLGMTVHLGVCCSVYVLDLKGKNIRDSNAVSG